MTFSIVAYCERTGQVGVAATTALQAAASWPVMPLQTSAR